MDFKLTSPKAITYLRQLHGMVFVAAQWAVQVGECRPEKVLDELRLVIRRLEGHWRGKTRDEILAVQAQGPRAPWPKEPRK